jgi:predicted DNA-binding protein
MRKRRDDDMTRQLNLRVENEFAERLERLSRKLGKPMAVVLEAIGRPAIEAAEADLQFEAEALAAWEEYQLTGAHVTAENVDALFDDALARAKSVMGEQRK